MVYKLFAIYDDIVEKRACISKILSRRSAVHSRHRCGHCKYTQELYEIDFLEPEFVLPEEVRCTGAVAYRHVLSRLRIFRENEFEILNPDGMGKARNPVCFIMGKTLEGEKGSVIAGRKDSGSNIKEIRKPATSPFTVMWFCFFALLPCIFTGWQKLVLGCLWQSPSARSFLLRLCLECFLFLTSEIEIKGNKYGL